MNTVASIIFGTIITLPCTAAGAGVYKCTDPETGAVTFSQVRCATDAQPIDVQVDRPRPEDVARANARQEAYAKAQRDKEDARLRAEAEAARQRQEAARANAPRPMSTQEMLSRSIEDSGRNIRQLRAIQSLQR
jgi:hypothetical protein